MSLNHIVNIGEIDIKGDVNIGGNLNVIGYINSDTSYKLNNGKVTLDYKVLYENINPITPDIKKYIDATQSWHPVPIALRHSWINKTGKDQGQEWHQHQDAFISGTYYYQTTGKDGIFSIMNPIPWMQQEMFPFGNVSAKHHDIIPAVGKLLLFPGWLLHSVEKNKTDDTRISISFNFHRDYWKDSDSQNSTYI